MNAQSESKTPFILYFNVHQMRRLKRFQYADIGADKEYFDNELNETVIRRVAHDCYVPGNEMLLRVIQDNPAVKVCFSISGETLELLEMYAPDALLGFQALAKTGNVEFFGQTKNYSLACLISPQEFQTQVISHSEMMMKHFNMRSTTFVNSEMIYNDDVARLVGSMGFKGILAEGASAPTDSKVHHNPDESVKILQRNTALSDTITYRFGAGESRLSVQSFLDKTELLRGGNKYLMVGVNYEVLGESFHKDAGILDFIRELIQKVSTDEHWTMVTAAEAIDAIASEGILSIKDMRSWAHDHKDISAWLGNDMQHEAFEILKAQEEKINLISDELLIDAWRSLQATDHFYYMTPSKLGDGDSVDANSQYPSPYEAFINYTHVLNDLASRLNSAPPKERDDEHPKAIEFERQHATAPLWAIRKESEYKLATESRV